MAPAIELRSLYRRYGRNFVLADITLTVEAGRTVLLKGANGAGKTTLLRVLATRLRPSRGSGRIFGADLAREAQSVRRRVAYLSVLGGHSPTLTARENLHFAATIYGSPATAVDRSLASVGLGGVGDRTVRTFSSGMKKRLGLARLLLAPSDLWLLDEPYAALDEEGKGLIDDLLTDAQARGKTVIMASHALERCGRFAEATLELEGGRLRRADPEVQHV